MKPAQKLNGKGDFMQANQLLSRANAITKLRAVIDSYISANAECGPGAWDVCESVDSYGRPSIGLVYTVDVEGEWPQPHPEISSGDEPWKKWGGDAILSAAGLESWNGFDESYRSRYAEGPDDDTLCCTALIEVAGEDE